MIKKLRVTIEGKAYEVEVEILETSGAAAPTPIAPRPATPSSVPVSASPTVAPPVAPPASRASAGTGDVPSPLAGRVVSVNVNIGDTVDVGAQLITLEAMKMNTFVFAPQSGKIGSIHIKPGDAVEEGQALVTLE